MDRRYPQRPLVGVGAIIFREDSVLLVQRGREPSYGKWSIPGGAVELGESLHHAVSREVLEEVGLEVAVRDLVVALDRVIRDQRGEIEYHYVLLDFLCEWKGGEPAPASDVLNCAFVSLKDLSRYHLTDGTEKVIRRAFYQNRESLHPVYDPAY
ncbi:MAG: NUDIX hydrolase [Deltaproteobacteria bacterium]|nr:NUDIX hydrolase [Deltaproteobacteria bacterium]